MNKENDEVAVRLDKWMWASRFCKTRSLARTLIQSGKVSYNGQPCKPGKIVELGAVIKFPAGYDQKEVIVKEISDKRTGAQIAKNMYEETEQSIINREKNDTARKLSAFHSPASENKPDKKQRRLIHRFKRQ
ncbi:S4 domain-containing protein [Porticoccaceae bacterium]|jgi:ribosome-associated heat shock protein Hsp15|nr:S4 domain-containing protein [Porticoccaceae bacterium]MDB2344285.1 S4 domain-containing protein [Porticoccaceae bacterium]MDB2486705.1 S4 domain-containing protein [Porticoccaceae bacterium]MDB2634826.1 S4 domain-containing protein [Porticoccaceae bacterium]MDB2664586.1 S4 domain-containing protein [Porticoccaceae bacterium]